MAKFRIYNLAEKRFLDIPNPIRTVDGDDILSYYEADQPDERKVKWGLRGVPPQAVHLRVPAAALFAEAAVLDVDPAIAATATYEGVNYIADVPGAAGNFVLVFDGVLTIDDVVSAWNSANPGNTVSHDAADDTVVPSAGDVVLTGGIDETPKQPLKLKVDPTLVPEIKKRKNAQARAKKIAEKQKEYETALGAAIDKRDGKENSLVFQVQNLFTYIDALQTAAAIDDSALSAEGQEAKASLAAFDVRGAVKAAKDARDAAITDDSDLPFPGDGLPPDYDDPFLP